MFKKNVKYKLKALVKVLKHPELNVIDAIAIIESSVKSLKLISSNLNDLDNTIIVVLFSS